MPAIVSKSYKQRQHDYTALCKRLATEAEDMMRAAVIRGGYPILYLVGDAVLGLDTLNPRAAIYDNLRIISAEDERPAGTELLNSCSIPLSLPYGNYFDWMKTSTGRTPLAIFAD